MTKDSPEMETYSRLLSHLQESCKHKKAEIYEEFNVDISILISKDSDILRLIENDLKYILPSILLCSVYKDVGVRNAAIKSFETFTNIINKKPSIKNEPWYKDMESTLIAQEFSSHLIKLVEATDDTWPHVWSFVISLIVHDEQVHGVAINSLLKVVEIAFKLSRKFETVLEKAYYCWNRLIDIFSVHPRIVTSQKLIELLVRPLSTNLSLKCPKLKLETWSNLVHKVGFACVNTKCKLVIEPFIDFAYLKDSDSLCHLYPLDCIQAFRDIVNEKKLYRFCVTKIMSALLIVFESGRSDDLNEYIIEIWTALIDNTKEIEKANLNDYITELINKIPQIMQIDRPGLNNAIIKVTLEKKLFSSENLKTFILAQVPIMPIISSFMSHCDFQKQFFLPIVDNLLEYFLEAQNKKSQSSVELEIWDLMCEVFILWLKSLPLPQEPSAIDAQLLCSLLLVPLLSKQWSVPVQKTWNSVLEYTQIIVPSNNYLSQFIEKFFKELSESHISAEFAVEFCTFLTNKDKSVFKSLMPTFNFISKSLPSKDPKPLMDLLVLIENSIKHVPKQDLIKLLTELMSNSNSYGQPYDLRIKTKITKLQRKLFTLKDPNESSKDQDNQQSKSQEKEQQNGQKTRSPLMAHSNFLHRLAKAEEKKVKKRASMSSIFGDIHQNDEVEAPSPEKSEELKLTPKPSQTQSQTPIDGKDSKYSVVSKEELKEVEVNKLPLSETPVSGKDSKNDSNREEFKIKESEEKKLPLNGRSSPAIPSVVTVVTTPNRKRSVKQPEIVLSQESKKPASKATPPPPSYFEDEAMDYVIVPLKPKSTPLTEHQKEMMSKRRSDIPALYQDLSQDTQSMNSQSIKEIITLKEIKLNDTTKSPDVISTKDDEINNTSINTDEENSKIEQAEKVLIENGFVDKNVDDSQEIINDTQPTFDSSVTLSLTPTKHTAALPTQKNLLNKFNLLESDENGDNKKIDEEDEVEKENKIVNIEEAALQKVTPMKRRSTRKSTNKYFNKKAEETPKTKAKKEISESLLNTEIIPKGKSKKTSDTAGKNVDDASSLKVKNSDSQNSLKECEKNEISDTDKNEVELERKCKDKAVESVSEVITEDQKTLINHSEEEKTDIDKNLIDQVENTSTKTENVSSEIVVPLNITVVDDKLDKLSSESRMCDLALKNESIDVPTAVHEMPASADVMDVIVESVKENSESKSKSVDASTSDFVKEMDNTSIKNDIPLETMDISIKDCIISSEKKEAISDEVLKPDVVTELASSLLEYNSVPEIKLNTSKDVSSDAGDNGMSTIGQPKDSLSNCETSTISNSFNDNDVMIVDECQTVNNENLNIGEENNMETKVKVEEQEDIDHNSSGDSNAASWSMVTPEKKSRKRRVNEVNNAEKFSPKLLRSKRLSLTKLTPDGSSEKNKRNSNVSKVNMKGNRISDTDTALGKKTSEDKKKAKRSSSIEIIDTVSASGENTGSLKPDASDNMDFKTSSPDSEVSGERKASKRKNPDQVVTPPSQPKKAKTDSNTEEGSQDSLSLLKNNSVKPRKKKIIKSNIKASPNNLEQWLIKSGKSVVKKTLLSSNDLINVQSESKILNNDSEIQISSSEPKKIIVEMSPVPKVAEISSKSSDENASEQHNEVEATIKEDAIVPEINVVNVEVVDPVNPNLSIEKGIPSALEPEMPVSSVVETIDDIETIERQFLEAIKRRAREEEEENIQKSKEDNLPKPKPKRRSEEDDDDDEELLTESLKCDETELERTSLELERNSNASRVKLESMIYAKYKTTLRRPRRRKRLLRRVKKSDDENELEEELEEEEETFEERRERLVTPFRPSSGRSAQMVKMATSEEEGPPVTPVRRRSITPLHLTENWPEGRCEQWVPCVPTPPGISPSLSILKRKVSPVTSPSSSPNNKKKRVSFLDPPVSKGLLYSKGSDNIGQVQHANIPPGKKPVWKGFEGEVEDKSSSDKSKMEEVVEGFDVVEAEDELTAIQEFLNSTPDAPWKDTPLAGDISKIPGILSCSDPVHNIISRIASPGSERMLSEELQRLKINTIGGFCSLTVSDIMKLSIRPAKVSTLYNVLKDYFQCQPSSSKKSQKVKLPEDSSKSLEDGEKMDFVETQIEITTLGIEMGVQVDPSEICSDDTFTFSQMSQKTLQNTQDLILTPPVVREPELYSDSQEDIKIPTRDEIGLMFQSDVFIKRAAPYVTFNLLSKLSAAAAEYFGPRPD